MREYYNLTLSQYDVRERGFTLIELIMVMVVVGTLAVFAAPRIFDVDVFKSRGFADQVQATLRYAQKEAIAQHRNVCVAMTASDITLTIASVSGAASACDTNLVIPGQAANKISTPSAAITLTPATASFNFDALGKPSVAVANTVAISGASNNIVVEAETGYVHSP